MLGTMNWQSVSSSDDGTHLAADVCWGNIWTSSNSGSTWTECTELNEQDWTSINSSADGATLAATARYGSIWTSRDAGRSWHEVLTAGESKEWSAITSSSDGTRIIAVVSTEGNIWVSKNSGETWQERSAGALRSAACHQCCAVLCSAVSALVGSGCAPLAVALPPSPRAALPQLEHRAVQRLAECDCIW